MKHRAAFPLSLLLSVVIAATALAAGPKAGTYKGTLGGPRTAYTVSMKLKGTKLSKIKLNNVPFYCSSGGPPIPVTFPAARISKRAAFTVKAVTHITSGHLKGHVGERLTLTGRFAHGKVTGRLTTVVAFAKQCSGSSPYTARRS